MIWASGESFREVKSEVTEVIEDPFADSITDRYFNAHFATKHRGRCLGRQRKPTQDSAVTVYETLSPNGVCIFGVLPRPRLALSLFDSSTGMIWLACGGWEESARNCSHPRHQLLGQSPFFSLRASKRSRIDAQAPGQHLLGEAQGTPARNDALAKRLGRSIIGNVTEEGNDPWDEA